MFLKMSTAKRRKTSASYFNNSPTNDPLAIPASHLGMPFFPPSLKNRYVPPSFKPKGGPSHKKKLGQEEIERRTVFSDLDGGNFMAGGHQQYEGMSTTDIVDEYMGIGDPENPISWPADVIMDLDKYKRGWE